MRGHVTKKGRKYFVVVELGHQPVQRCEACGKRASWLNDARVDTCPKCGSGELVESTQRRQRWLDGHERKRDADAAKDAITSEANNTGSFVQPSRKRLGAYLTEDWLPGIRSGLKPSTFTSYSSAVTCHIAPRLGQHELRELRPHHLNAFYAELLETGLSPTTVRYFATIVSRSLKDATRWGLLTRNVAEQANPPRPAHPEMRTWDVSQLRAFLAHVADDRLHPAYLLAATTGMRRGELLGARWVDVDLDAATLKVRQTLIVLGYKPEFSTPKTKASTRTIALDPGTVAVLRKWRKHQLEERLQWGSAYRDSGLLFTVESGALVHPQQLSHAFKGHAKAAGLPVLRLHDLRHSFATIALGAGVNVKTVSARLGHANIATTLNCYAHATPVLEAEAAAKVASLIGL